MIKFSSDVFLERIPYVFVFESVTFILVSSHVSSKDPLYFDELRQFNNLLLKTIHYIMLYNVFIESSTIHISVSLVNLTLLLKEDTYVHVQLSHIILLCMLFSRSVIIVSTLTSRSFTLFSRGLYRLLDKYNSTHYSDSNCVYKEYIYICLHIIDGKRFYHSFDAIMPAICPRKNF